MPHIPKRDQVANELMNAVHAFFLMPRILDDIGTTTMPTANSAVMMFSSDLGRIRIERDHDKIILDITPLSIDRESLHAACFHFPKASFQGSALFATGIHLPASAARTIASGVRRIAPHDQMSLNIDPDTNIMSIGRYVDESEPVLNDLSQLTELACRGINAGLPEGFELYRTYGAFGAHPTLVVMRSSDNTLVAQSEIPPKTSSQIDKLLPYLSLSTDAMLVRPDSDNPNTIMVAPLALSYAQSGNREEEITRLASIFIRLEIARNSMLAPI